MFGRSLNEIILLSFILINPVLISRFGNSYM